MDHTTNYMIEPEEIALALQIMKHEGDNVAYFGMRGKFLYSEFDKTVGGLQ